MAHSDERDKARENVTLVKETLVSKLGSILEIKRLPIPFSAEPMKATVCPPPPEYKDKR